MFSGMTLEWAMSKDSSTRVSVLLTRWPPGPDEREKRSDSSRPGMRSHSDTARASIPSSCLRNAVPSHGHDTYAGHRHGGGNGGWPAHESETGVGAGEDGAVLVRIVGRADVTQHPRGDMASREHSH